MKMNQNRLNNIEEVKILEELERRKKHQKLLSYYPDEGPLRRELYQKHIQFFEAGITKRERLFMAANRVGKTEGAGGYETALHMTGLYPQWWKGRRFSKPLDAWAAGDTSKTVRDIIQFKLLGPSHEIGTGLIPGHLITRTTSKTGLADACDMIYV
jgi:hypothetical protein